MALVVLSPDALCQEGETIPRGWSVARWSMEDEDLIWSVGTTPASLPATLGWVVPPAPRNSRAGAAAGACPTADLAIKPLSGKLKMSSFFCG